MKRRRGSLQFQLPLWITFTVGLLILFSLARDWTSRIDAAMVEAYALNPEFLPHAGLDLEKLSRDIIIDRAFTAGIILILVALMGWLIARRAILRHIEDFYLRLYAVSRGQYDIEPYPELNNEISSLYEMFHKMVEEVERQKVELTETERKIFGDHLISTAHAEIFEPLRTCISDLQQICNADKSLASEAREKIEGLIKKIQRASAASIELIGSGVGPSRQQD